MANTNVDIRGIIGNAAQRYGIDPEVLSFIAQRESNFNPQAKNPNSSAKGLFQFIDGTAKGYNLDDPFDPEKSSDAAARFTRDNISFLRKNLGREPTKEEIYLSHQQGPAGALKLLSNPNAKASDIVGVDAIQLNKGNPDMPVSQFLAQWGIGPKNDSQVTREASIATPQGYQKAQPYDPAIQGQPAQNNTSAFDKWNTGDRRGAVKQGSSALEDIFKGIGGTANNSSEGESITTVQTGGMQQPQQQTAQLRIFEPSRRRSNPLDDYLRSLLS